MADGQGYEVNAEVVARRLQSRLAEQAAMYEWELAVRDARIAALEQAATAKKEPEA